MSVSGSVGASMNTPMASKMQTPASPQNAAKANESYARASAPKTQLQSKPPTTMKSPQAGGNGLPTKPVSTSTKTVQSHQRIDVKA